MDLDMCFLLKLYNLQNYLIYLLWIKWQQKKREIGGVSEKRFLNSWRLSQF